MRHVRRAAPTFRQRWMAAERRLLPCAPPGQTDGWIFLSPFSLELDEPLFSYFARLGSVDRAQRGRCVGQKVSVLGSAHFENLSGF